MPRAGGGCFLLAPCCLLLALRSLGCFNGKGGFSGTSLIIPGMVGTRALYPGCKLHVCVILAEISLQSCVIYPAKAQVITTSLSEEAGHPPSPRARLPRIPL